MAEQRAAYWVDLKAVWRADRWVYELVEQTAEQKEPQRADQWAALRVYRRAGW